MLAPSVLLLLPLLYVDSSNCSLVLLEKLKLNMLAEDVNASLGVYIHRILIWCTRK